MDTINDPEESKKIADALASLQKRERQKREAFDERRDKRAKAKRQAN